MILIIGGTGKVGSEVVKQLKETGAPFKVMVRSLEKGAPLEKSGIATVLGDLTNRSSLEQALQGVEKVFLLSVADPNQVTWHGNLIETAKKMGIKHIVRLSALGADPNSSISLGKWHGTSEKQLATSGVPFTHLEPHFFMQNILMFGTIATEGKFYAPMKNGKISLVDARDIAAVAVKTLTEPGHQGKTYVITGPEALSFQDIAEKLSRATGNTITYVDVPPDAARQGMLQAGMPDWLTEGMLGLYEVFSAGHAAAVSDAVQKVTGKPARSFDAFARDFAPMFKGAATVRN